MFEEDSSIPAIGSPYWGPVCIPLALFIALGERHWSSLKEWAKARSLSSMKLRHCLAWLEDKGYAETYLPEGVESKAGRWIWRKVEGDAMSSYVNDYMASVVEVPSSLSSFED
tara:strand:+ start:3556 stop:3894 length:339 start_codon:yes stop_codon:yes gene_type:complete